MADETTPVPRKRVDENAIITIITPDGKNPKQVGSNAYRRFGFYRDGMTVREAKAAGVHATDIVYDSKHNFILLETAEEAKAKAAPKKAKKAKKPKKAKAEPQPEPAEA